MKSIRSAVFLAISVIAFNMGFVAPANAQVIESGVIMTEFFEELYAIDVDNSLAVDILNSPTGEDPFGQLVEVLNPNTIIISDFDDLYRYDVGTQLAQYWTTLSFTPSEITRDLNGNLIAVGTEGVHRIDGNSGMSSLVHDQTFFGTDDAVVDSNGNIYVTEFFESVGVVGANGGYTPIGNFGANEFAHIELGIDGQLYLASTFGGEFWSVDPNSGAGTLLGSDLFTFMDDIQVDANNNILFSGQVDSVDGVFLFDTLNGSMTTIIDGDDYNNGFWNGLDIDIFESQLRFSSRNSVPEPSSALMIVIVGLTASSARRRRGIIK